MNLTEVCIRRPVFAWMLMAATVVFGAVAATRIGISQFPDVDFPTITVQVTWEGAAPEVIENDVVEPLEEALVQVEGVTHHHLDLAPGQRLDHRRARPRRATSTSRCRTCRPRSPRRSAGCRATSTRRSSRRPTPRTSRSCGSACRARISPQLLADIARYRVKEKLQTVPGVGEVSMGGYARAQRPHLGRRRPARRARPDRHAT